ncbi:hypothetical protein HYH02_001054 [Chlamydomonas schloesseri]|uniref:CBM20 domain-containing protein n=1 Tax=Chlamydomonas schloesseri TaxID=2026947 RepID=A0A836BC18_9CHLO|nr:hypothetical protein HYH02_001054 [Chlamydomonas schloesseri]|eukprot:KAG2454011.1 hypothetical protein HYH02_001054 [Chlamydomonas schloesseri]
MMLKGPRPPCAKTRRSSALTPKIGAVSSIPVVYPAPSPATAFRNASRPTLLAPAAAVSESPAELSKEQPVRGFGKRLAAVDVEQPDVASLVSCRFIVPHHVTKPGQQLFLSGSSPALGEWDPARAVPMEWQEGHNHVAVVRLPASRLVQAKLVLMENGRPVYTEEGNARDLMLLPSGVSQQPGASLNSMDEDSTPPPATPAAAAGQLDYQIMCHVGNTEATQILRLPVVLPAKDPSDRRVLCKFVVMLDGIKLEPRQYPVVVGSAPEMGAWNAGEGIKLMRQVGGYWTRRVELPLYEGSGDIQAKVVICNADGTAAVWEPGTTNRVLTACRAAAGSAAMHIFVCRWSQPGHTPTVCVPVQHEDASKEFVKQLDAAQKEIGMMRQAVTAKSRQVQSLESELAAVRRSERAMRDEVSALRSELGAFAAEAEAAAKAEVEARREVTALGEQLARVEENYERQVNFLAAKLEEMEREMFSLQDQLANSSSSAQSVHNQPAGYGSGSSSNGNGNGSGRPATRASWR